jgi:hypothetical protein
MAAQAGWRDAWAVVCNPATRTSVAIRAKDDARATLVKTIRKFVKQRLDPDDAVTNADRQALGLHIHKEGRTRVPIPDTAPRVDHRPTGVPRETGIWWSAEGTEGHAKPDFYHGVECIHDVFPVGQVATSISQLKRSTFDTRSPLKIILPDEERGLHLCFALRWENTRGEKGPWTEIFTTIVP